MKSAVLLAGSLTVEAAFVMGITLIAIGVLITGIFGIHERVVKEMLLSEAVERVLCVEDGLSEDAGIRDADVIEGCSGKLREYYGCGSSSLSVEAGKLRLSGSVKGKVETGMSVPRFDPEQYLRLLTAISEASGTAEGKVE